jgi:tryptophanyl-tRNA synthetase
MVLDWLAVGLDPARCTIFQQSAVKEHAELFLLLGMVTPVPWLERNPTYKEQRELLVECDLSTLGFLGYPVRRRPTSSSTRRRPCRSGWTRRHIELAREIARRFNATTARSFRSRRRRSPRPDSRLDGGR